MIASLSSEPVLDLGSLQWPERSFQATQSQGFFSRSPFLEEIK
jgi:hypothetical protein